MNDPLKKYRRLFRAWRNANRLRRESDRYSRNFGSMQLSVPDEAAIRRQTRQKFQELQPKKRGDLSILAIYHHYNWEDESLKLSLEKFGFVRHIDWLKERKPKREGRKDFVTREMSCALLDEVEKWVTDDSADVIFAYLSGENITWDAAKRLGSLGIPVVNMSLNDKEAFVGRIKKGQATGSRDICRYFDLCWTSTEDAVKKYCVEGAVPIYLPEGGNADIYKPYDVEKTVDVSFVGQCYGYRPRVIRKLEHEGIHVEAYGYGWPNGPLSTTEMVHMYSRSRINLGFGGVGAFQNIYCLKGRDFEIPMSGGLYLTEYNPELERCYKLGEEIVTYTGFEDLVKRIRYLLSDNEQADKIRKRGLERARHEHTWGMRFEKIFGLMGLI